MDLKIIPWALNPLAKSITDYLQDILCDIPGFREDLNILYLPSTSFDEASRIHGELCRKTAEALHDLYALKRRWESRFPDVCYEVAANISGRLSIDGNTSTLFLTVIYFRDLERASEINLYNTIQLLLLNVRKALNLKPDSNLDIQLQNEALSSNSPILFFFLGKGLVEIFLAKYVVWWTSFC